MPTLVMSTALLGSYYLGSNSGVVDFETGLPSGGLFGTCKEHSLSTHSSIHKNTNEKQR